MLPLLVSSISKYYLDKRYFIHLKKLKDNKVVRAVVVMIVL